MEGSICKYTLMNSFIHSFIAWFCSLQLKLLTNDQTVLFIRGDSKGPGAVWTYPCVTKIKDGKVEATYDRELEEEVNLHIPAGNMHEAIFHHMLHIEFLSYRHGSDRE
jgi:hypothetical protein